MDNNSTATAGAEETSTRDEAVTHVGLYVGLGVALAALILVIAIVLILGKRRFRPRRWSTVSARRLFIRGFSTVSQRGVLESAASFEMVSPHERSVSSCDVNDGVTKTTPKKPERRRTRTSTSTVKYENVLVDESGGFAIRKSVSMNSNIPFIDGTVAMATQTEDKKEEEELDDVFD